MTDPVLAPSFPEQLEQAAKEARDFGTHPYALSLGQQMHALGMLNDNADLLTRAAALARAAEKVVEKWPLVVAATEPIYTSAFIHGVKYSGPQISEEMEALRALVLREGKSE